MKSRLLALTAGLLLLGAGPAAASGQDAGQSADSQQSATSSATSTQYHPSNDNISVRVLSPGNDGDVTQSNSSRALSFAGNKNDTDQTVTQDPSGSGSAGQEAGQSADNGQSATSTAESTQYHPSNENISVRMLSDGDNGSVDQSNDSTAKSFAGNKNETDQGIEQSLGGSRESLCGCDMGSKAIQAAGQDASNSQDATSTATSTQYHPSNENISVRVLSGGDNGDVNQSNDSTAKSFAGNKNELTQGIDQSQGGSSGSPCSCAMDSKAIQAAGQDASNWQDATSSATSTQYHPTNENKSVRVLSEGDNGDVNQSNSSKAFSFAGNKNETTQDISQSLPGYSRCCLKVPLRYAGSSTGIQAAGQDASNWQDATSDATSKQFGAKNENKSIRLKHSDGSGGDVWQSNDSFAGSIAFNKNKLDQSLTQTVGEEVKRV